MGVDTETVEGLPYTVQTCDSQGGESVRECWGQASVVRAALGAYLLSAKNGDFILAAAHYLRFDIQVLFRDKPEMFLGVGEIDFTDEQGIHWKGSCQWPVVFAIARYEQRSLLLIDTFKFFFGGLAKVAKDLDLDVGKLDRPPCVTENRAPTADEHDYFMEYAKQDARVVLGILKWVDLIWELEDCPPVISIAHQAGKIFTRKFSNGEGLDTPDQLGQLAGYAAYQGGRNSLRAPGGVFPVVVDNCSQWDVRSMYPKMATDLPSFFGGQWVWMDKPPLTLSGVVRVWGTLKDAPHGYRLLMDAAGNYVPPGVVDGVWTTTHELATLLHHKMLDGAKWSGYVWEPGSETLHPMRDYFRYVFDQKQRAKDGKPALYLYYKYLANSLTGKFCSTIPRLRFDTTGKLERFRVPGAMFNTIVGGLITGTGRVRLFDAEVASTSIHGATDSIVVPPWGVEPQAGEDLGDWEFVCRGTFVAARNKCYAFLGPLVPGFKNKTGQFLDTQKRKIYIFQGKKVLKWALHAFQGDVLEFLRLVFVDGSRKYTYKRMTQLRESQRRQLPGLQFNQFESELKLGGKYQ